MDPFLAAFLLFLSIVQSGPYGSLMALDIYLLRYPAYLPLRAALGSPRDNINLAWLTTSPWKAVQLIYFILLLDLTTFAQVRLDSIIGLLQELIRKTVEGFTRIDNAFGAFRENLEDFLAKVLDGFDAKLDLLLKAVGPEGDFFLGVKQLLEDLATFIKKYLEDAEKELKLFYNSLRAEFLIAYESEMASFKEFITTQLSALATKIITDFSDRLIERRDEIKRHIDGKILQLAQAIETQFKNFIRDFSQRLVEIRDEIKEHADGKFFAQDNAIKGYFATLTNDFSTRLVELRDAIKEHADGKFFALDNEIKGYFSVQKTEIEGKIAAAQKEILDGVTNTSNRLFTRLETFIRAELAELTQVIDTGLATVVTELADFINGLITNLRADAQTTLNSLLEYFDRSVQTAMDTLNQSILDAEERAKTAVEALLARQKEAFLAWYTQRLEEARLFFNRERASLLRSFRTLLEDAIEAFKIWIDIQLEALTLALVTQIAEVVGVAFTRAAGVIEASVTALTAQIEILTAAVTAWSGELTAFLLTQATLVAAWVVAIEGIALSLAAIATELAAAIGAVVTAGKAALASAEISKNIVAAYLNVYQPIVRDLGRLTGQVSDIQRKIEELPGKLKTILKDFEDELKKEIKKTIEDVLGPIKSQIASEVADRVVGESYIRWNSVSSFYPTCVFILKEEGEAVGRRRVQVKIGLNLLSSEITELDVERLKLSVASQASLSWTYGTVRCSYVSADKRFKTVLFVQSREEAVRGLTGLMAAVGLIFDPLCLSVTEDRARSSITLRTTPLANIEPYTQRYDENFKITLFRAVLLVNGLDRPISLFESST